MGRPIALTVTGLIGISVALSTHAQAYRIRQLDSIPGTHTWCVRLTDEGDVVGKTTDRFVVWQSSQGFARPAGLNLLHEYDEQTRIPSRTEHIDDAGYWYGSGPHGASVWSSQGGHEHLERTPNRTSRINDGSWPTLVVGYEHDQTYRPQPVAWFDGAITFLDLPDWADSGVAEGVNTRGVIVGTAYTIDPDRFDRTRESGLVWINGEMIELDTLVVGFDEHIVQCVSIDERGQIAANVIDADGFWKAAILEPAGADLNGDWQIGSADFSAWLSLAGANDRRADINSDGRIDVADMTQLMEKIHRPAPRTSEIPDPGRRARQLARAFLLAGVYDDQMSLQSTGIALHPIQPVNWVWQEWKASGKWNEYHPEFNPNCHSCAGDDPNNPHAPDGAPGWPGSDPYSPYKPNGGPGGAGADGDPAGDGGDGGAGKDGDGNREPGNGGPGGAGGDNTDDGPGGDAGDGGNGGDGVNEQPGGDGGTGGDGGNGGPNGGNSGDGGDGGNGGSGGPGIRPGSGAPGGPGGNGGDAGDSPRGDAGNGGDGGPGGTGGTGGSGQSGPGGPGGAGGDAGSGGDAPNGDGGNGGSGGNGGTGSPNGTPGGDGSGGSDGSPS